MKSKLTIVVLLLASINSFSQGFERKRTFKTTGDEAPSNTGGEILQQASITSATSTARLNLKVIKCYAKVGKKYIDLYILSSIPVVATNPNDSIKNLGNELQSLYGGLANAYFSKTWSFFGDDENEGLKLDFKGGYKLTETSKLKGKDNLYLHSAQAALELRFLAKLLAEPKEGSSQQGVFQAKATCQLFYNDSQDYYKSFRLSNGSDPSKFYASLNLEASLHIFDQFYVSGGASLSSLPSIQNLGYFKVTYSRK